jgi:hypothetical protein
VTADSTAARRVVLPDLQQPARVIDRGWPQEQPVDRTEDGGVGADAEREGTTATMVKARSFDSVRAAYRRSCQRVCICEKTDPGVSRFRTTPPATASADHAAGLNPARALQG